MSIWSLNLTSCRHVVSWGFCITYLSQIHENMVCWSYLLSARMRLYAEQDKTQCTRYQLSILTLRNRLWKICAKPLLWEIWFDFRLTNLICLHRKVCINLLKGGTSFFWSSWSLYERSCRISFTIQFFFVWGAFFFTHRMHFFPPPLHERWNMPQVFVAVVNKSTIQWRTRISTNI